MNEKHQIAVKNYPNLKKCFGNDDNFCHLIIAIEQHFSMLFDLSVLEAAAGDKKLKSEPYFNWFWMCMDGLKWKYTIKEIVAELAQSLNSQKVIDYCMQHFIFVANSKGLKGKQLAYMERIASGTAESAEAMSFLDMLRLVKAFKEKKTRYFYLNAFGYD